MEEAQFRFGAISSADVKLWLTSSNGEKYERNPVHLLSVILERSEFFKVKMSERWSSDKPTEIRVTTTYKFDEYLKCIQLIYGERVYFTSVEQCLTILSVASELLADDCINRCMQYLEAVRWSAEQETQIRDMLSSLGMKLLPDLASRLVKEDNDHISFLEKIIKEMISVMIGRRASNNRETAKKYIGGILEGNASEDVVAVCERELVKEFKSATDPFNYVYMRSLFEYIKLCNGETLRAAFLAFVENHCFLKIWRTITHWPESREVVFNTIIWFMKATGNGKIIVSKASRISFLTLWLPIMVELFSKGAGKLEEIDGAVLIVIESLPPVDKKHICTKWLEVYNTYNIGIAAPLALFKDLHDAHHKSTSKQ